MNFTEKFKELSNIELFRIIERKEEYQIDAVNSAELEISVRNLSKAEVEKIQFELEEERRAELKKKEEKAIIKKNIQVKATGFFDFFSNPFYKKPIDKIIILVCILIGVAFIVKTLFEFVIIKDIIKEQSYLYLLTWFIPLIYLSIMVYGLLKKKQFGWKLTIMYFVYYFFDTIYSFIVDKNRVIAQHEVSIPEKDNSYYIFLIFYTGTLLLFFNSKETRDYYGIKSKTMKTILILTSIVVLILWFPSLLKLLR